MNPTPFLPRPVLRQLTCGILLALTTVSAQARVIDNETADIVAGDATESWELRNGARLRVDVAQTLRTRPASLTAGKPQA